MYTEHLKHAEGFTCFMLVIIYTFVYLLVFSVVQPTCHPATALKNLPTIEPTSPADRD